MSLLVTELPIELLYQVLSIFITPSPSPFGAVDLRDLRAVRNLSQTCRDLRTVCSPLWYAEAKNRDTWDSEITFSNLLTNAASHGHIEVLQQAVDAGFAPGDPHSGLFEFQLDSTGRVKAWTKSHPGPWPLEDNSVRLYHGNLAQVSILGVAAPHQKLKFLRWLFNLEAPPGSWTVRRYQPSILEVAAEAGELDVIQYILDIFPPQSPFVDSRSTLFRIALWSKAPNDTLEYLMGHVELTGYETCKDWFEVVIYRKNLQGLNFLLAHDKALGICEEYAMGGIIVNALDAALLPERRGKICSRSVEIISTVLRWGAGRWPNGSERRIHYSITKFTEALRGALPRKQRFLLHIANKLTYYYRVTWTQATEAGDEPWSFAFLENCVCGRTCRQGNWVKLFKLLCRRTPQGVCRAFESRYGPDDRSGPLRLMADLMFSDSFKRLGFCRCRRRILEILLGRCGSDINEGRGTALGTTLHTFCENVFRLRSRGYFEQGPLYMVGSPWEMLPFLTFLVNNGCDVEAHDVDGRTAWDWLLEGQRNLREDTDTWEQIMSSGRWELYNLMRKATYFWPTNETSSGRWDLLVRLFGPERVDGSRVSLNRRRAN